MRGCSCRDAYRSCPLPTRRERQTAEQSSTQHTHHASQRHQADIMPNFDRCPIGQRDLDLATGQLRRSGPRRGATCFVSLPWAGSPIVCTGRNIGSGSGRSTPRRTWLRQFHSRPRLISYRRAISAMPEPGCSVSATILSFSPRLQRRRRSTPVMISMLLAAFDLNGAHTNAS